MLTRSPVKTLLLILGVLALVAACAPSDQPADAGGEDDIDTAADDQSAAEEADGDQEAEEDASADEADDGVEDGEDLDALIDAAQEEGELTAYWHSSRIEDAGDNFEEEFGIAVSGSKLTDSEQTERVTREVDAGNVQVDVIGYDDGALLETQLLPEGYVENWVPPAVEGDLPEDSSDPLVYLWQPIVWGYNTETYGDSCPVTNVWELTEDDWADNIAMLDPEHRSVILQWFTAIVSDPDSMEQAYEDLHGEPLETDEEDAGWEFVKRLGENNPLLFNEDVELAEAVGAAGQDDPPMGMYYLARHRELDEKGLHLRVCHEMEPFVGFDAPTFVQIVNDAPNPNAARLFVHWLYTEEGVAPWAIDDAGGYSPHPDIAAHGDNPYETREEWEGSLLVADNAEIHEHRQALLDHWLLSR